MRLTLFRRIGDGSTQTHTIDFAGVNQYRVNYAIEEWTGTDTGGTNGANTVVQTGTDSGDSGTALSAPLAAFGDAVNNVAYLVAASNYAAPFTEEGGYTVLDQVTGTQETDAEYKIGEDTEPSFTAAGSGGGAAIAVEVKAAGGGAGSAADTGTLGATPTEDDAITGDKTVITTLTGDTFLAAGATFNAQRQAYIDHFVSAQSEAAGWNAIRSGIPVTAVARTSDTIVTLTLPALPMNITANDVVTHTVPAEILTGGLDIVATPTITFTPVAQWGADGAIPVCTNPATAAGATWKVPNVIGAGDYVSKVTNPATAAGAGWVLRDAVATADYVPIVDDQPTPSVWAWAQGPSRAEGGGGGGGSNEPAGMSAITNRPCSANDELATQQWSDDARDVAAQPEVGSDATAPVSPSGVLSYKQPAGSYGTTLDPGVSYFSTGFTGMKYLYARWPLKLTPVGWKGHPFGNNKFLYVYRNPSSNTLMLIVEFAGSGDDDLFPVIFMYNMTLAGYTPTAPYPANVNNPAFPRNTWQIVEVSLSLGTPSTADGTYEMWVAGVKTHNITGITWRTSAVDVAYFQTVAILGGSGAFSLGANQYALVDNIYVSGKA